MPRFLRRAYADGISEQTPHDERDDGPHPFIIPDDPAEREAAQQRYHDEMNARIVERLKKQSFSRRGRWRPVE